MNRRDFLKATPAVAITPAPPDVADDTPTLDPMNIALVHLLAALNEVHEWAHDALELADELPEFIEEADLQAAAWNANIVRDIIQGALLQTTCKPLLRQLGWTWKNERVDN